MPSLSRALLATSIAATIAAAAGCAARVPGLDLAVQQLENGVWVVVNPDRGAANIHVEVWYPVGSYGEPAGQNGLAHVAEHVFELGATYGASGVQTYGRGVTDVLASTNYDRTRFRSVADASALDEVLDVESQRMRDPLATATDTHLSIAVSEVEHEIDGKGVQPDAILRGILTTRSMAVWHVRGARPLGDKQAVARLQLADVSGWLAQRYATVNAVVVVAGAFEREAVLRRVVERFARIPRRPPLVTRVTTSPPIAEDPPPRLYEISGPVDRAYVIWNLPGLSRFDTWAVDVIRCLVREHLRERLVQHDAVATFVSATLSTFEQFSELQFELGPAAHANPRALIAAVHDEIARVAAGRVPQRDVRTITRELQDNFVTEMSDYRSIDARVRMLADGAMFHGSPRYHLDKVEQLHTMDAPFLSVVAQRVLAESPLDIVVYERKQPE